VTGDVRYGWMLGSGCCGSSLLSEIVARHPDVGFVSNLDDRLTLPPALGRANNALYRKVPQALTRKGRARLAPSEAYRALAVQVSPLVSEPGAALHETHADPWLVERFRAFFASRGQAQGRPLFLHKFTGHCRAGLVEAAFPSGRYVNVVRDGRAVAASLVRQAWWTGDGGAATSWKSLLDPERAEAWHGSGRSAPLLAAFAWELTVLEHESAREDLAGRWLDVRYEDVLVDTAAAMARVRRHLGLAADAGFDRTLAGYRLHGGRRDAFRTELSSATVALLERHVGPTLERYGYL
jgi:Sulfotransferase family